MLVSKVRITWKFNQPTLSVCVAELIVSVLESLELDCVSDDLRAFSLSSCSITFCCSLIVRSLSAIWLWRWEKRGEIEINWYHLRLCWGGIGLRLMKISCYSGKLIKILPKLLPWDSQIPSDWQTISRNLISNFHVFTVAVPADESLDKFCNFMYEWRRGERDFNKISSHMPY